MHDRDDEQFECYLKSFRPVDPGPLPFSASGTATSGRRRVAFAVTAVGCFAVAALLLITLSNRAPRMTDKTLSERASEPNQVQVSAPALTRLAFDDHDTFVELISKKAESQLPPMKGEQSALRVLAKE